MRRVALNIVILSLLVIIIGIYLATQLPRMGVVFQRAEPIDGAKNAGMWLAALFEACVVLFGILIYQDRGHIAPKIGYGAFLLVTVWGNLAYHYGDNSIVPFQQIVPIGIAIVLPLGASLLAIQFRQAIEDVIDASVKRASVKRGIQARKERKAVVPARVKTGRAGRPRAMQLPLEDILSEHGFTLADVRAWWNSSNGDGEQYAGMVEILKQRATADAVGKVVGKSGSTVRGRW